MLTITIFQAQLFIVSAVYTVGAAAVKSTPKGEQAFLLAGNQRSFLLSVRCQLCPVYMFASLYNIISIIR